MSKTSSETRVVGCVCHVCGSSPCYLICPMADPFGGDQRLENEDYEFNARYDHVREANDAYDPYGGYDDDN